MSCWACTHQRTYDDGVMVCRQYCDKDIIRKKTPEGVDDICYRWCDDSLKHFRKHNHGRCPHFKQRHWYDWVKDCSGWGCVCVVLMVLMGLAIMWSCSMCGVEICRKAQTCQKR